MRLAYEKLVTLVQSIVHPHDKVVPLRAAQA